jgi:hypothetical protein
MSRTVENVGVGSVYATFNIDTTSGSYDLTADNEGQAVGLSGDNEIDLGANGGVFLGQVVSVQTDVAVVQVRGIARVPYNTGTPPTVGGAVALDGAGKVKASATGRGLVLAVDTVNQKADVLL